MKICFVSKECAGLRGGGIGTYIAEAGKALRSHGHEVHLLTTVYDERDRESVRHLPFDRVILAGDGVADAQRRHFFHGDPHYGYAYLVHQTLGSRGERYDYIEFADYEAEGYVALQEQRLFGSYGETVLGLMLHSPTWECFGYDKQSHRANLRIRETCNLEEEAIRIAPLLNCPSRGLRDEVSARLGLDRDIAIIRYPMELDRRPITPPSPRKRLSDLDIIYYGRIEPRKGVDELVDAFHHLPECRITLIGGDVDYSPYGTSCRKYLERRAPANVAFHPPMPRPALLERIRTADVCVFPSLLENWPNTCIEAMAAGRVVIGSKHGGMSEMIEDGVSGFHVDGRSSADIVRVFRDDLTKALPRLPEIGRAAAARIRGLSDEKTYCEALIERVRSHAAATRARPARPQSDPESQRVTVIVPFHRDADTIDATIDSVTGQTHRNLEILLVNDGSPLSDAQAILDRQRNKDPRIKVLSKPNGGLGSARNQGLQHVTGDFVLMCDADNLLRPDYARTGVEVLTRFPDSHFVTPHLRYFNDETGEKTGVYNPLPFDRKACLLTNRFGDAGAFFRASLFRERGLRYDTVPTGYEDWALWMDLHGLGMRGERVPRELYDYRVRANSMMKVDSWPNHPALVGWLIQHHLPNASALERDLLTTLFQHAGQSIARVAAGAPDHLPPAPAFVSTPVPPPAIAVTPVVATAPVPAPETTVPTTPRVEAPASWSAPSGQTPNAWPLRYKVVDEMSRWSRKVPGLNRVFRKLLGWASGGARRLRKH